MIKLIHITHKGQDMGTSYIYSSAHGWMLGDAFYDLEDKVRHEVYRVLVKELFKMLDSGKMQGSVGVLSYTTTDYAEDDA